MLLQAYCLFQNISWIPGQGPIYRQGHMPVKAVAGVDNGTEMDKLNPTH
jgi:hypothetical protein